MGIWQLSSQRNVSHPNIVRHTEAFFFQEGEVPEIGFSALAVLMEFCDSGTLRQLIAEVGPLPEQVIGYIASQVLWVFPLRQFLYLPVLLVFSSNRLFKD